MGRDALIRALALMTMVIAASGSARLPGLTVTDVWKQHVALDRQIIRVSGVVIGCRSLDCALQENPSRGARRLSLGSSDTFDDRIQSRLGLPVVIEGRLDATCLHAFADEVSGPHGRSEIVLCTDRAPMLSDPKIVSLR